MNTRVALFTAVLLGAAGLTSFAGQSPEGTRQLCGWFDNPTPANVTLTDREGEWTVGLQGGHQAEGAWPRFKPHQWVRTGSSYGYGCACLVVVADVDTREVRRIVSSRTKALSSCRHDRSLPKRAN